MRLIDKVAGLSPRAKKLSIAACSFVLAVSLVWGTVCVMSKQVSIVDDKGEAISYVTYAKNIADVLAEKGISLGEFDEVSKPLDSKVKEGDTIYVYRSDEITFVNGKETSSVITAKPTVAEFLKSHNINPDDSVKVNVSVDEKIAANMTVQVTYIDEKTVNLDEVIEHNVRKIANSSMTSGQTKIKQEGSDGLANRTYHEYYENGELVSRDLVEEEIKIAAVDEIVEYGTMSRNRIAYSRTNISRGSNYRYKKVIDVTATAYCTGTRTATGMPVRYGVVAVDPRVIPLGSRLYIEGSNGTWVYGTAVAADTGGAVKGNKIDLYVESYSDAVNFGRRSAKVYILE